MLNDVPLPTAVCDLVSRLILIGSIITYLWLLTVIGAVADLRPDQRGILVAVGGGLGTVVLVRVASILWDTRWDEWVIDRLLGRRDR